MRGFRPLLQGYGVRPLALTTVGVNEQQTLHFSLISFHRLLHQEARRSCGCCHPGGYLPGINLSAQNIHLMIRHAHQCQCFLLRGNFLCLSFHVAQVLQKSHFRLYSSTSGISQSEKLSWSVFVHLFLPCLEVHGESWQRFHILFTAPILLLPGSAVH